jgi:excisionase family DNA binding protein
MVARRPESDKHPDAQIIVYSSCRNAKQLDFSGFSSYNSSKSFRIPTGRDFMHNPADLISPKQAARAMGVSESSLKRWCDQGLIKTVRTAGGHRKMPVAHVLEFIREHEQPLVSPELLGLQPASEHATLGLMRGRSSLVDALLAGDWSRAHQIVFDLYLARHSLSVICDEVVTAAFREIGERWACHEADIYQERRGCEIMIRILHDLRRVVSVQDNPSRAMGGTIEGDFYTIPTTMAELVLCNAGFHATSLGTNIPISSLIKGVQQYRPNLFWLSVSHIREGLDFIPEFARLSQACAESGTALAVGGRGLTPELRHRMKYSAFCDTMQHLEAFVQSLTGAKIHMDSTPKAEPPKTTDRRRK